MTKKEITDQLEQIVSKQDFATHSAELIETWISVGLGIEAIEPIIRFMENHPTVDYGAPGALVHFVERFYGNGYEEILVESIKRKPTGHTVAMLNAVINGTKTIKIKKQLIEVMQQVKSNPLADQITLQQANHFLERLTT